MSAYPGGSAVETAADSGESRARMFVPTPPALRAVRRFVADVLCAWNADLLVDDASIVACELATNALIHARSPFRICLSRSASALRIAVRDASRDQPALLAPDPRRTGGRGIPLIAALSTAWGSVAETDGKTVWVDLSI
jgi:anti-sigma regulatory factor (Ser/Thr protein kinase)